MCSRYRYFRDEQKHNNISFDICVWIATIPGMLIVVLYTRIPPVHICHVEDKVYKMMYILYMHVKNQTASLHKTARLLRTFSVRC